MAEPRLAVVLEAVDNASPVIQRAGAQTNDALLRLDTTSRRASIGISGLGQAATGAALSFKGTEGAAQGMSQALGGVSTAALALGAAGGPLGILAVTGAAAATMFFTLRQNAQDAAKALTEWPPKVDALTEAWKRFEKERKGAIEKRKEEMAFGKPLSDEEINARLQAGDAAKRLAEVIRKELAEAERAYNAELKDTVALLKEAAFAAGGLEKEQKAIALAEEIAAEALRKFAEAQDAARSTIQGSGVSFQQFLATAMQFPDVYQRMKAAGDALGITPGFSAVEWSKLAVSLGITVEELNKVWAAMTRLPAVADTVSTTIQANWINAMHTVEQYNRAVEEGARITQNAYARLADDIRRARQESMEAEELRQEIRLIRPDIRGFGVAETDVMGLRHMLRLIQIGLRRPQVTNVFLDGRQVGASIGDIAVADEQVRAS